jgi:uncharacterized protein
MTSPASSMRYRLFGALAHLDVHRPWTVLIASAVLSLLCVVYTKARLEFRTGQDDLVSENTRDNRNYLHYTREFPDLDGLIVVVKTAPARVRAELFADTLARRLEADRVNVKSVFYRIDSGVMGDRALLYLSVDELKKIAARIDQRLTLLRSYAADPSLASIFRLANRQIDLQMGAATRARSGGVARTDTTNTTDKGNPGQAAPGAVDNGFLDATLAGMLGDAASSPAALWNGFVGFGNENAALHDGYLLTDNGKYLLLHIAPGNGAAHGPDPVEAIQSVVSRVRADFPDVEAGMTGGPALAHAEETTTQHDMTVGSIIAVTGLVLLMVIPFRGVVEPFFAVVALLAGVAWSFGFTTLVVGHLNLLSAVFTSVLAGIGINFPIHLMARYDEARRRGLAMPEAVELAVVNTGTGVFASACIMALAFLMPMFTDFKGIAELGLISAAGLFCCLVSALLIFPAMIALRDRNRPLAKPVVSMAPKRSTLEKLFARPGLIISLTVIATIGASVFTRGVGFDQDLLKLQASDVEAVRFEKTLLRDSGRSSWFAVALAPTRKLAERQAARFRELTEVSDVETIGTYIPDRQEEKLNILARLGVELQPIAIRPARAEDPAALMRELRKLDAKLRIIGRLDRSGATATTSALVAKAVARLQSEPNAFANYSRLAADSLDHELAAFKLQLTGAAVTERNLPAVLRERFIGASGQYLVQIYPKGDVWEDAPLERFITALRTVDRSVTGPPVQTYSIASVMRTGYERAAVLALIAVFVFVFADFRNLRDTLLATVPLVFGGAWLLETMGVLGWEFNLANLFAVPIVIGMGVDNGVNMLYRWREERDKSSLILTRAVGKSVTICSLTTIAAFAALIPADHRGISSLGWVLSLGTSFILLATLVVLPALFELVGSRIARAEEAHPPTAGSSTEMREDKGEAAPRRIAGSTRG